jgi:hypothetical protein
MERTSATVPSETARRNLVVAHSPARLSPVVRPAGIDDACPERGGTL